MKKQKPLRRSIYFLIGLFILFFNSACEKKEDLVYLKGTGTVTDIDGNIYKTIIVGHPFLDMGTQEWMAENLRVTHFRDGSPILVVSSELEWHEGVQTNSPYFAWSHYNEQVEGALYGALYNFHTTVDSKGLCPNGWRVSTRADWEKLCVVIGGHEGGGKLKSTNHTWLPPNVDANDELELSGLPAGFIGGGGQQVSIGEMAWFWTSTAFDSNSAYAFHLNNWDAIIGSSPQPKWDGRSIRCIKE